jgi:aspartokinase-like uncharacterized kinase
MGTDNTVYSPCVVKVGGSLFDLPALGPRLAGWLRRLGTRKVVVLAGGGAVADAIRQLDTWQALGEEPAHWLALAALHLTGRFLADLLPEGRFCASLKNCRQCWLHEEIPVLDAYAFARADEGQPGRLPHSWEVTSDSVAARVASVLGARQLVLLKSVTRTGYRDWTEAAQLRLVDPYFARAVSGSPHVRVINFRDVCPQPGGPAASAGDEPPSH